MCKIKCVNGFGCFGFLLLSTNIPRHRLRMMVLRQFLAILMWSTMKLAVMLDSFCVRPTYSSGGRGQLEEAVCYWEAQITVYVSVS